MKVAIVTGASRGIGKACALALGKKGYTVVVNYSSNEAKAQEVLDEIKSYGSDGMIFKADVSNPDEVNQLVKAVYNEYKQIDLLVNNAGIVRDEFIITMTKDNLDKCFDLNVKGYFYLAQQVGLKMFRKKSGCIINMSSVSSKLALAGQSVYSATKGAINSMTQTLAKELDPYGIRVNAIAPGFINTEMIEVLPEDKKEEYLKNVPLKRFGEAAEVGNLVCALASDELSYITGQVIVIDGGLSL